jgi:transcriptional regulator with XRE-family HTH domain
LPLGLGKDTTCGQANPFIELRVYSRRMIIIPERSIEEIAAAMKSVRRGKGMTLRDVETKSGGVWKAVVIGSYERCDRALSIKKAINLANFYQVPLNELLGLGSQSKIPSREKITLDIRATSNSDSQENDVNSLRNFATLICAKRQDWNGEVLSIRTSDLTTIGLLLNMDETTTYSWLSSRGMLLLKP